MLHLASRSDPRWVERALREIDEVVLDHAHCEKKAASTALSLVFRYAEHEALIQPLSALAREELAHFELVLDHLRRRGQRFRRLPPSPYAARLMICVRTHEPARLLDTLLCCALIEARSCERMRLLADGLRDHPGVDAELERLYRGLLASEARHHATYVDLARGLGCFDEHELRTRWDEVARHEAAILAAAEPQPRLHA